MAVKVGFAFGNPITFFFGISMNYLFSCAKCRHGPAERKAEFREEPRWARDWREFRAVFRVAVGEPGAAEGVRA